MWKSKAFKKKKKKQLVQTCLCQGAVRVWSCACYRGTLVTVHCSVDGWSRCDWRTHWGRSTNLPAGPDQVTNSSGLLVSCFPSILKLEETKPALTASTEPYKPTTTLTCPSIRNEKGLCFLTAYNCTFFNVVSKIKHAALDTLNVKMAFLHYLIH